jgi:endonuclease/exonuclease/phosphatase family metal-dependent hydrolase
MPLRRFRFFDPVQLDLLKRAPRRLGTIKAQIKSHIRHQQLAARAADPHRLGEVFDHHVTVASYNIHKGLGVDRRFDPERIAAVITEIGAALVALQEADQRFGERRGLLNLHRLEEASGLTLVRTSPAPNGHGWRGNALLIRSGAVRNVRRLALPGAEPRGALVVDLELPSGPLRVVAAHLGLLRRVRRWQVRAIVKAVDDGTRIPTLLLGDLNEWRPGPRSSLHDLKPFFGPLPAAPMSFPSYYPMVALDRVIGSPGLVTGLEAHHTPLSEVASDHLPLKATIDIPAALEAMGARQPELLRS